jgi:hypothetical protein
MLKTIWQSVKSRHIRRQKESYRTKDDSTVELVFPFIAALAQPHTNYKVHSLPPAWSSEISDTDNRGIALYGGKVEWSPRECNASLVERRDDKECVDVEFLRGNSAFDLEGLYEETDETSSFELSYPSSRSVLSFALIYNKKTVC